MKISDLLAFVLLMGLIAVFCGFILEGSFARIDVICQEGC